MVVTHDVERVMVSSVKYVMSCLFALYCATAATPVMAGKKSAAKPVQTLSAPAMTSADTQFLALRDAARNDNPARVAQLAAALKNYEIPSYVDYYALKTSLRSADEATIRDYLQRYQGSAIADRLRNDWLLDLGRRRAWALFDEHYPQFELNDDLQLKCYDLMSKALKGQRVADDARAILVSAKDYGEACPALVATLVETRQFGEADVWAQLRLASEQNATASGRRLAPLAGISEKQFMQSHDSPSALVARGPGNGAQEHQLYILALGRLARTSNPALAVASLQRVQAKLSAQEKAQAWAQVAYPAAQNLAQEAFDYWQQSEGAQLSPEAAQWKVRSALLAGDFKLVKHTIEAMPADLRADPAWMYWLARALMAEAGGHEIPQAAHALLQSLSSQHHFYGQLALEELGQPITIPPTAEKPSSAEMAQAEKNAGLRRAIKFFALGLRFEGIREWNWELRRMNERQLLAAAEFARQNQLLDRMVNTSDRTKNEFNFQQRYPTPHLDVMQSVAGRIGLDKAWAYGLIRQESRFILNAKSSVGASGLMQLMPATAQWVAAKIGMQGYAHHQVNNIETNITLGANYLKMVLDGLGGSQTLASAGYNAGPGRPKNWRSNLPRTVEGAIFAEAIPFLETRTYVKNVLSNATYYAALFEKKPQSLKARLGTVVP